MLSAIKQFFNQNLAPQPAQTGETAQHRVRLAAAALLVEVVRSDEHFSQAERAELLQTLDRKFGLEAKEANVLIDLAEAESREATDLYQFTSEINRVFTPQEKVKLIEALWRVAYADRGVHHYEEHLIRKIADLIHVSHAAFIAAKLGAQGGQA